MIEVSYTSLFLLKILCCHDNGEVYLNLIPSFAYWGQKKNEILRDILSTVKTDIQEYVLNYFYPQNKDFFDLVPYLGLWCKECYINQYQAERNKTQKQLNHDMLVIGKKC